MVNENVTSPTHHIPPHEQCHVHEHEHHHCMVHPFKRVSWTAIFVGALVGVGLGFLLNLFGLAIGLSAFTLDTGGASVVAIGGLIGILIGVIVSMVVAGYAAGYLGRLYCPHRNLGILYGFTTWSVALILSAAVTAHFSHYAAAYTNVANPVTLSMQDTDNTPNVSLQNAPSSPNAAANPNVRLNASPGSLAWTAFTIFALFFIGAISTCVGACWGMSCRRED